LRNSSLLINHKPMINSWEFIVSAKLLRQVSRALDWSIGPDTGKIEFKPR